MRLFRAIRSQLMGNERTHRYLFYALGEIILIVLGILIALNINNWNEERKNRIREQVILRQLLEDYTANLDQLNTKIAQRNIIIRSALNLLDIIDNDDNVPRDTIALLLGSLLSDPTFDPIVNDLAATGNLVLISNDTLQRVLSNWTSDVLQVKELEDEWRHVYRHILLPKLFKLGVGRDADHAFWLSSDNLIFLLDHEVVEGLTIGPSMKNIAYQNALNDPELEGIIAHSIAVNQVSNLDSETLRERIRYILDLIKREIQ